MTIYQEFVSVLLRANNNDLDRALQAAFRGRSCAGSADESFYSYAIKELKKRISERNQSAD